MQIGLRPKPTPDFQYSEARAVCGYAPPARLQACFSIAIGTRRAISRHVFVRIGRFLLAPCEIFGRMFPSRPYPWARSAIRGACRSDQRNGTPRSRCQWNAKRGHSTFSRTAIPAGARASRCRFDFRGQAGRKVRGGRGKGVGGKGMRSMVLRVRCPRIAGGRESSQSADPKSRQPRCD